MSLPMASAIAKRKSLVLCSGLAQRSTVFSPFGDFFCPRVDDFHFHRAWVTSFHFLFLIIIIRKLFYLSRSLAVCVCVWWWAQDVEHQIFRYKLEFHVAHSRTRNNTSRTLLFWTNEEKHTKKLFTLFLWNDIYMFNCGSSSRVNWPKWEINQMLGIFFGLNLSVNVIHILKEFTCHFVDDKRIVVLDGSRERLVGSMTFID